MYHRKVTDTLNSKETAARRFSEFVSNDASVLSSVSWMGIGESKGDSAVAVRNVIMKIVVGYLAFIFQPIDREWRSTCENKSTRVLLVERGEKRKKEKKRKYRCLLVIFTSKFGTKFIRISLHDDRLFGKRLQEFRGFFVQG